MIMKKASARFIAVFLTLTFLIVVFAYLIESVKEKLPARLEIIPEIKENMTTTSTTIPLEAIGECINNEDCPDQTKCEGNIFYQRIKSCGSDYKCYYGDWIRGNCDQSKQNCGAACATDGDCAPGETCDTSNCMCISSGP
jgi:hypothetical protein